MTRLSAQNIIKGNLPPGTSLNADFDKSLIDGTITSKGYNVIYETALRCPCRSQGNDFQSNCVNCGGGGWLFVNPTLTKMIVSNIASDRKYQPQGREDTGKMQITAYAENLFSFMDRITIADGLTDHTEVLFPKLDNTGLKLFAFTRYNIEHLDFLGLFVNTGVRLTKLVEGTDYTYHDNVIEFAASYNALNDPSVTIRYAHAPVYHIIDIPRDTMRSTVTGAGTRKVINLPIHAIGVRAHLIKGQEDYTGTMYVDNSWLPTACMNPDITTSFNRQLKYTLTQDIYDNLTSSQKVEMGIIVDGSPNLLGVNGVLLKVVNP